MVEIEDAEDGEEVGVCDAFAAHYAHGIGVDDLLAEGAGAEVWSLGDVENLCQGWFADCTAVDGPESSKDSEEG